ncbi:MAG: hypothetical protein A3H59_00320 [Candidatus Jacksonbacteria bacterium RIFCSPLOWO2_02_FULL_43_9]|nr:MAG: hypothetical protein A3H59_00320 [Candidatus Jacksonbacteria bacterium RIFCSPLOWO2_02_FULL_43_9]
MQEIIQKIKDILENEIKPMLAQDGGSIEFIDFKDGILTVRLKGACAGCPFLPFTLKENVEKILKETIPEIKEVVEK